MMRRLLDILYPRRAVCLACGSMLGCNEDDICDGCLAQLAENRYGARDKDAERTGLSGAAYTYLYRGAAGGMVRSLKYGSARVVAPRMAHDIALQAKALGIDGAFIVTYVPMHPQRERQRGFNHAEVLARHVAADLNAPCMGLLARTRNAPQQARLSREERLQNLKGAFCVPEGTDIADRTILLIDDVWTTGATATNCARTLRKAGAARIYFASYAIGEGKKENGKNNRHEEPDRAASAQSEEREGATGERIVSGRGRGHDSRGDEVRT